MLKLKNYYIKVIVLETRINNINTKLTSKDEELKREITQVETDAIRDVNTIKANSLDIVKCIRELDEKIISYTSMAERMTLRARAELNKKIEEAVTKIINVESTSVNAIQIINAANKTSHEETNKKINDVKSDLSGEIKKVDDTLNNLSIKVPFQFKVASILAADKADKVEIFATIIEAGPPKIVSYDILSRVVHHDNFKSFKTIGVHNFYFNEVNNDILIV